MERRRKYLINRKLQFGFLQAVLTPLLAGSATLYYFIYAMVSSNMMIIPENVVENLLPALRKVNIALLFIVPVIIVALTRWAIVISNRVAGPIYRMQKDLDKLAEGDYSVRLKFRKNDRLFHPIAERLNKVLDKLPR